MKEEINVNVNAPEGVLVIRHGNAPEIEQPRGITVVGQMGTCVEYSTKRVPVPETTHVIVDRDHGTITMYCKTLMPVSQQDCIQDKIALEQHFLELGLNGKIVWDPNKLGLLFKRRRKYFADISENAKLVTELLTFRANVETAMEQVKDNTARRYKTAVEKVVNSGLPTQFKLKMPIVKGLPAEEFTVEIILEPKDGTVAIYLDSIEAEELLEEMRNAAINEEVKQLQKLYPVFEI